MAILASIFGPRCPKCGKPIQRGVDLVTRTAANPKCLYCGSNLIATELYCEKWKSVSKARK